MDLETVTKLYPQFGDFTIKDRRQNKKPYAGVDRRSGIDRRSKTRLDSKTDKDLKQVKKVVTTCMREVPTFRKLLSAYNESPLNPDNNGQGNWLYAAGMIFRMVIESEEDMADVMTVINNDNSKKDWQHKFWAFRGSLIDRKAEHFVNTDLTVYDIQAIQKFLQKIGITDVYQDNDCLKFEGSRFAKIIARAMLRIPILGACFFAFLQIPDIIKAKNKPKQALKVATSICIIMSCSALGGATGGYKGKALEMLGMGTGIMIGSKIAEKINNQY